MQWGAIHQGETLPANLQNSDHTFIGFKGADGNDLLELPNEPGELLERYDNTHFLFRIGEDGKPKFITKYNSNKIQQGDNIEKDPMKEELGIFRYIPEIYRVVEDYNNRLSEDLKDDQGNLLRKKLSSPLDWKWVAAMMMQESNPSSEPYHDARRYDPLQTSNNERDYDGVDSSILTTVRDKLEGTELIARDGFHESLQNKKITPWGPDTDGDGRDNPNYQDPSLNEQERMDAKTGIELAVIGLLNKTAKKEVPEPRYAERYISGWDSWEQGVLNYNSKLSYLEDVQKAYNIFEDL
ncbi:hypothetical protein IQ249_16095 [Lusitaniella coriacea LEGE 07157]|uniref:Uncharacterized protein n=1 Tax=Lusitaniella coriacea LEGE 07157 TaxID=945747 RepID=A0A8J7IUB4_9CYAN|nr:hypothetical protein [Lusitaniella coriacea]MBE9117422.1 hypothetical protein [Lusitaniella coriacea LEGE 07157]